MNITGVSMHYAEFIYNPYCIMGISCTATRAEIQKAYDKLCGFLKINESDGFSSPFSLSYLEKKPLDEGMLNKAFSDAEDIKSKVFSFSDECFAYRISKEECLKRLDNISSYDEFLSCYLWLITNDTEFVFKDMWASLCSHIEKMMSAQRIHWSELFDSRFSIDELNESYNLLDEFHKAFKMKILSPLHSFENSSEKSSTAKECLFNILASKKNRSAYNRTVVDDELSRLANEAKKMLESDYASNSSEDKVSLVNNVRKYEDTSDSELSLIDTYNNESNVFQMAVNNAEYDSASVKTQISELDTTKAFEIIGKSDIQENKQFAIDDIDTSKQVESLRAQKKSNAKEMNGLVTVNGQVKQVYGEVNPYAIPKSVSREEYAYNQTEEFEKRQAKQVKKHYRANTIKTFIKLLLVAGLFALFWWQTHR